MGPRRGDNKHFHTRAKAKVEKNEHHRVLEGHSRNEDIVDIVDIVENHADKEARKTSQIGTPPRTSNTYHCAIGGIE
jgi:hypothetical protein